MKKANLNNTEPGTIELNIFSTKRPDNNYLFGHFFVLIQGIIIVIMCLTSSHIQCQISSSFLKFNSGISTSFYHESSYDKSELDGKTTINFGLSYLKKWQITKGLGIHTELGYRRLRSGVIVKKNAIPEIKGKVFQLSYLNMANLKIGGAFYAKPSNWTNRNDFLEFGIRPAFFNVSALETVYKGGVGNDSNEKNFIYQTMDERFPSGFILFPYATISKFVKLKNRGLIFGFDIWFFSSSRFSQTGTFEYNDGNVHRQVDYIQSPAIGSIEFFLGFAIK